MNNANMPAMPCEGSIDREQGEPVSYQFASNGVEASAEIAKEADELLEECEAALSCIVELHGSMRALKALNKVRQFRGRLTK